MNVRQCSIQIFLFYSDNSSEITVKFESSQIVKTTYYVTYKLQNFIADVGGLAGLFLGFSLLSMFEMILNFFAFMYEIITKFVQRVNLVDSNEIEDIYIIPNRKDTSLVVVDLEG